ncbi:hypothetical protein [Spirosoma endbachense]|uniref:Uncharacterized protein n=1 Tax=Spirosoma endbachense TaxID=2666025 RepID=A0A6P1VYV6_9BACT|nr:hypothetical protein [Spirosoma endbachense]QHV97965.1 hypothetical protein GJR95_24445 [Spirosoma endbachense]
MTKEEKRLAGIIYAFASVAALDTGGTETKEETDVVKAAIDYATRQLGKLGLTPNDVLSLQACIDYIKGINTASKKDKAS